ncbi:unnamed protein product [Protopolystoma xenopodis]|uniref:Uncharacterized protein n=1 Tax=Protopolystoma xenopodis TaxID=117903 RepID=A0A448XMF6_9PLAT|nr:unnamed protein product [Protopolystoma xenopodis]
MPIHCVVQLLKSQAFVKNNVQIKDWIYKQVCESVRPMHPLLPDLLEAHALNVLSTSQTSAPANLPDLSNQHYNHLFRKPTTAFSVISESELTRQFSADLAGEAASSCAPGIDGLRFRIPGQHLSTWPSTSDSDPSSSLSEFCSRDLTPQILFLYYALFVYDHQLNTRLASNQRRKFEIGLGFRTTH